MGCHEANYTHPYRNINANSYLTVNYPELHTKEMDFAEWLQREMDSRGLKQQALADIVSRSGEPITQATISRIINRRQDPAFGNVVALARALGRDATAFMQESTSGLSIAQKEPVPEYLQSIADDLLVLDKDEADLWRLDLKVKAKKARKELLTAQAVPTEERRQQGNAAGQ